MKCLVLFVHRDDESELVGFLRESERLNGFSLSHIDGHGLEPEQDAYLAARDRVAGAVPRLKAEIVMQDEDVPPLLEELRRLREEGRLQACFYRLAAVDAGGYL